MGQGMAPRGVLIAGFSEHPKALLRPASRSLLTVNVQPNSLLQHGKHLPEHSGPIFKAMIVGLVQLVDT